MKNQLENIKKFIIYYIDNMFFNTLFILEFYLISKS